MNINRKLFFSILILLITCFCLLSVYVAQKQIPQIDIKVSHLLQSFHAQWLDRIMLAISIFGELPYSLLSVLVVAAIFFKNKFKLEAIFITCILLSGLIILLVKNLVNRPRPTEFYVRLVEINRFKSFPSGHVMSYVLFFGFLIFLMHLLKEIPKIWRNAITIGSYFLLISISFSRIYLGAHWFTDTLGGALLGLICLLPLAAIYLKKKRG